MFLATSDSVVNSPDMLTVFNPATEAVLAAVPRTTQPQFVSAIEQAGHAFGRWRRDEMGRRDALRRCAAILRERTHTFELATLLTQEQGKPKREAVAEVFAAAHWFASMAELEMPAERLPTAHGIAEIQHDPLGIVGAITAWNFPVFLAACKIAAALLPGNVVLLKPSPFTPLSTMRLVEMLTQNEAGGGGPLPHGVVTALAGDSELGNWFVQSDQVAHVSFTGSVEVGKRICKTAAESLKPVTLELGGNDAAIVLADADLPLITPRLFWGAFTNAGQFCTGIKRLYVQEPVFAQVVGKLSQLARETIVGDGLKPKTQMGPLTHQGQFRRIIDLVERARQRGATVVAGGEPLPGRGYFYPPTIITGVGEEDPLVAEEQFGPVLPVQSFRAVDEVIHRANSTKFGLGGSVWTRDERWAARIADGLECGTVWINQHGALDPLIPFGGRRQSGIGCENGWAGVAEFTKRKVIRHSPVPAHDTAES